MSANIYAKFKNLDIVQWVTRNVYSYQSLSKISKSFADQQLTKSRNQISKEIWHE